MVAIFLFVAILCQYRLKSCDYWFGGDNSGRRDNFAISNWWLRFFFYSLRYCVYMDYRVATIASVAIILFVAIFFFNIELVVAIFCSLRYCVNID